jgi:hypothetical protein
LFMDVRAYGAGRICPGEGLFMDVRAYGAGRICPGEGMLRSCERLRSRVGERLRGIDYGRGA